MAPPGPPRALHGLSGGFHGGRSGGRGPRSSPRAAGSAEILAAAVPFLRMGGRKDDRPLIQEGPTMATKKRALAKYDPDAKPSFASQYTKTERIVKAAGIKVWFDSSTAQKVSNKCREEKIPALFIAQFDGSAFMVFIKYGSNSDTIAQTSMADAGDLKKRRALMQGAMKLKLADKKMWEQFDRDNPDPQVIKELEFTVYDCGLQIDSLVDGIKILKNFSYPKHRSVGRGDLILSLGEAAKKKGLGNYFEFAKHAEYKKPDFLYETYLKKGAKKPIKAPSSILKPVLKAIEDKKKPDLKKLQNYVHNVIDKKVVKSWAPEMIKHSRNALRDYKKKLAVAKKKLDYYGIKTR